MPLQLYRCFRATCTSGSQRRGRLNSIKDSVDTKSQLEELRIDEPAPEHQDSCEQRIIPSRTTGQFSPLATRGFDINNYIINKDAEEANSLEIQSLQVENAGQYLIKNMATSQLDGCQIIASSETDNFHGLNDFDQLRIVEEDSERELSDACSCRHEDSGVCRTSSESSTSGAEWDCEVKYSDDQLVDSGLELSVSPSSSQSSYCRCSESSLSNYGSCSDFTPCLTCPDSNPNQSGIESLSDNFWLSKCERERDSVFEDDGYSISGLLSDAFDRNDTTDDEAFYSRFSSPRVIINRQPENTFKNGSTEIGMAQNFYCHPTPVAELPSRVFSQMNFCRRKSKHVKFSCSHDQHRPLITSNSNRIQKPNPVPRMGTRINRKEIESYQLSRFSSKQNSDLQEANFSGVALPSNQRAVSELNNRNISSALNDNAPQNLHAEGISVINLKKSNSNIVRNVRKTSNIKQPDSFDTSIYSLETSCESTCSTNLNFDSNRNEKVNLSDVYNRYVDVMYTNRDNLSHTINIQQELFEQQLRSSNSNHSDLLRKEPSSNEAEINIDLKYCCKTGQKSKRNEDLNEVTVTKKSDIEAVASRSSQTLSNADQNTMKDSSSNCLNRNTKLCFISESTNTNLKSSDTFSSQMSEFSSDHVNISDANKSALSCSSVSGMSSLERSSTLMGSMEWVAKRRSDGTRYIIRRPVETTRSRNKKYRHKKLSSEYNDNEEIKEKQSEDKIKYKSQNYYNRRASISSGDECSFLMKLEENVCLNKNRNRNIKQGDKMSKNSVYGKEKPELLLVFTV